MDDLNYKTAKQVAIYEVTSLNASRKVYKSYGPTFILTTKSDALDSIKESQEK